MKLHLLILFVLYSSTVVGRAEKADKIPSNVPHKFSLSFVTYNHTQLLGGGTSYLLTDSSIVVLNSAFQGKGDTVFKKSFPASAEIGVRIRQIKLDTLASVYTNWCVMITSGDEYLLHYKDEVIDKRMQAHHYYLEALDKIVGIINSLLPQKYQYEYLLKDTKQNCKI